MHQNQTQHQTFNHRLRLVGNQWSKSLTFFCEVYAFVLGLVFVLSAFIPAIPPAHSYDFWQLGGRTVLGIVYVITSFYAMAWPERRGWIAAVLIPAVTGVPAALYPIINPAALAFWIIVIITLGFEIHRRIDTGEWESNAR